MVTDLRRRLIVGIAAAVFAIVVIVLAVNFLTEGEATGDTPTTTADIVTSTDGLVDDVPVEDTTPSFVPVRLPPQQAAVVAQADPRYEEAQYVVQLAKIFTERFGSHSSQNDNTHIQEAQSLSTDRMAGWVASQATPQEANYRGVTSRVIASELVSFEDFTATVNIAFQEERRVGNTQEMQNQEVRVELVKESEGWKVDGFYR